MKKGEIFLEFNPVSSNHEQKLVMPAQAGIRSGAGDPSLRWGDGNCSDSIRSNSAPGVSNAGAAGRKMQRKSKAGA
ncbi:MAG TPA: hypothetical protein VMO81_11475, partial [Aestuariivirgaceae bacterium]|nr:hypothetical protein [Aestuariivirgaceae bacterium]